MLKLSLIKLPEDALVFPSTAGTGFDSTRPRHPQAITGEFAKRACKIGFRKLRDHDLRGTHETLSLDADVPTSAGVILGLLSKSVLGGA